MFLKFIRKSLINDYFAELLEQADTASKMQKQLKLPSWAPHIPV
jgi:hypothetical protein